MFSDAPVLFRFWYFDSQTSLNTLLTVPILVGVFIGLATPFINLRASRFVKSAIEEGRILSARSASVVMTAKAELAADRETASAKFKKAALENAEASQAIDDAELDDEIKEELRRTTEGSTATETGMPTDRGISQPVSIVANELGERDRSVLKAMADTESAINPKRLGDNQNLFKLHLSKVLGGLSDVRLEVEVEDALSELKKLGLASFDPNSGWKLTSKGYNLVDFI